MDKHMFGAIVVLLAVVAILFFFVWQKNQHFLREQFIRDYTWPPQLLEKLEKQHSFTRKESALVGNGLRQFFLAYHGSGYGYVSMPSQLADDLWHEFILYTRDYNDFCTKAFGRFLHHTPAVRLAPDLKSSNEGLRRVWFQCCKQENIDPTEPTRVPLLFALDRKFNIRNGFVYVPDCEALRRNGNYGGQCGGDLSSSSIDGGTAGLGDGDGSGGGDGGGDGGGGCGGGD
jgi:hypothetical protein